MTSRTWRFVAAALVLVLALAAAPFARAEIGKMFGWYSYQVQPSPHQPVSNGDGQSKQPQYNSTISYAREPMGENVTRSTTLKLAEARQFLGTGAVLPSVLEGQEMLLYRELDKEGKLVVVGLGTPTVRMGDVSSVGFWVRYRPAGDHKIGVTYGDDFKVTTEDRVINGRSARLVWVKRESGKVGPAELWIQDGNWVYEMREDRGDMQQLIKLAESLQ